MKLLVIGATGGTGKEIVKQAAAAGHLVTALVRDAGKGGFGPPVEVAVGDVLDPGSLKTAVTGQAAVVCSLGSAATGPFKEMTLLSKGTHNLVAAMQAQGVGRLVCITGIGAGESKGHGPWYYNWLIQPLVLRGVYKDKTRQEAIVRGSGLAWTLVRPALLTNGVKKGHEAVGVITDLAGAHVTTVSRADVATFCLQELTDARTICQTWVRQTRGRYPRLKEVSFLAVRRIAQVCVPATESGLSKSTSHRHASVHSAISEC